MPIILELYELKNLCAEMAELGAANYAKRIAPANDLISQREAYREFQECRVKKWGTKRYGIYYSWRCFHTLQSSLFQSGITGC